MTIATIKSHWRNISNRILVIAPDILPSSRKPGSASACGHKSDDAGCSITFGDTPKSCGLRLLDARTRPPRVLRDGCEEPACIDDKEPVRKRLNEPLLTHSISAAASMAKGASRLTRLYAGQPHRISRTCPRTRVDSIQCVAMTRSRGCCHRQLLRSVGTRFEDLYACTLSVRKASIDEL